jgi:hypothetical protein
MPCLVNERLVAGVCHRVRLVVMPDQRPVTYPTKSVEVFLLSLAREIKRFRLFKEEVR